MLAYLGQAIILVVGGTMVVHGQLSIGALTAYFLYVNRFFAPITLLVQQYNTYQQGQASIIKLNTLLALSPSVPEDPDSIEMPPINGAISFDHVTFGYDPPPRSSTTSTSASTSVRRSPSSARPAPASRPWRSS